MTHRFQAFAAAFLMTFGLGGFVGVIETRSHLRRTHPPLPLQETFWRYFPHLLLVFVFAVGVFLSSIISRREGGTVHFKPWFCNPNSRSTLVDPGRIPIPAHAMDSARNELGSHLFKRKIPPYFHDFDRRGISFSYFD